MSEILKPETEILIPHNNSFSLGQEAFQKLRKESPEIPIADPNRLPSFDLENGWVYESAPATPYQFQARYFEALNILMQELDIRRELSPIVYFNNIDICNYPDSEQRIIAPEIEPETPHLYWVVQLSNPQELLNLFSVAYDARVNKKVLSQTAIITYLPGSRQDKNVSSQAKQYNGEVLNVQSYMSMLSQVFDRMYLVEPHSFASSFHAIDSTDPSIAVPVSPYQFLLEESGLLKANISGLRVACPDEGRNIVSLRISALLQTEPLNFLKTRLSESSVSHDCLTQEAINQIKRGNFLLYDDEINSGGTMKDVLEILTKYEASSAYIICVHPKNTGDYLENLNGHGILKAMWVTDSRQPVGSVENLNCCQVISLSPWIERLIIRDQDPNFNPYTDNEYKNLVIQEQS